MIPFKEKIACWIAYRLPRQIVYWCAIRVGAYATTGQYRNTVVPELNFMEALRRWNEPARIGEPITVKRPQRFEETHYGAD